MSVDLFIMTTTSEIRIRRSFEGPHSPIHPPSPLIFGFWGAHAKGVYDRAWRRGVCDGAGDATGVLSVCLGGNVPSVSV